MIFQQTLGNKATFSGIGLHTGKTITLTLRPAEAGTGIVFHRVDLSPAVSIEAHASNVVNTRLSTTIGRGDASVSTIEHLMAALYGCGIDNAHVDIDGPEVPIMDGSAAPFVAAIAKAGVKMSGKARKYLVVKKPVTVVDGDKKATIIPSRHYKISFDMQFAHPAVKSQFRSLEFSQESFIGDFAAARTFGFLAEVEMMKSHGLALGGSLENAVVIGDNGVINPEGLRFQDEFVRHKILDSVGDLSLAGHRLIGHVKATKSGHDLNHKLVTELLKRPDCYTLIEFTPQAFNAPFNIGIPELSWLEA
uniref:UDP-3-O-acyl-N-acetylglucosamine deacetylase n=1 Tax=Geobacter sp. (strain M21) TaxID=443144 RepID=LPXC_GEOSM|nr:RecName: Full=UDP-3-O-acyl-N-acetylglucosamine deacetylase; Short=UDP-3-O-acyl-GlcNAc deacetylase; AltName: Full=UDP-3-O-[R-3-hydroxymyristoyl]-N-acetylglucosamine deacetylase [Geobacter sp. M21]